MATTLTAYETRIGELSVRALRVGGEALLDRVTAALGVATRLLERVRTGALPLSAAVVGEIEASFDRAERAIAIDIIAGR